MGMKVLIQDEICLKARAAIVIERQNSHPCFPQSSLIMRPESVAVSDNPRSIFPSSEAYRLFKVALAAGNGINAD